MKRSSFILSTLFLSTLPAWAQWTVYDPAVHTQLIMGTAQEIAKFVQMINNQVTQIKTLADELNEMRHYVDLFGDPKTINLPTAKVLFSDLTKPEAGNILGNLQKAADGAAALAYDAGGIFHAVGTEFKTPLGRTVKRQAPEYRPLATIQQATDNFLTVSGDAAARRVALKNEIAQTTEQLKAARTDAEVQKIAGVLIGLSAALASTEAEVNQATASALVQDIANRNDERRQTQARKEQQHAEFTEAVEKYGQTFRLLTEPAEFPAR